MWFRMHEEPEEPPRQTPPPGPPPPLFQASFTQPPSAEEELGVQGFAVGQDSSEFQEAEELERPPAFTSPPTYGSNVHPNTGKPVGLPQAVAVRPDTVIDGADLKGLTVRATSQRGDDHRYLSEVRQDSFGLWTLKTPDGSEALLVCVADGVGSQPLSHRGSELACELLRDEVVARLTELLVSTQGDAGWEPLVGQVARRMTEEINRAGGDPKTWSTTLTGALIDLTNRRVHSFRVGDSITYLLRDGMFQALWDGKDRGEIAHNSTNALPAHYSGVQTAEEVLGENEVLVVCTDGLADPMANTDVQRTLLSHWTAATVPGLLEFAWQVAFRAKSFSDDRTAVCVWGR